MQHYNLGLYTRDECNGAVANASVTVDQNSVEGEVLFNITAFDLAGNNLTADQTDWTHQTSL